MKRVLDLVSKFWTYLLEMAKHPSSYRFLVTGVFSGCHLYELLSLTRNRRWLSEMRIATVIDVGSNTGQFISAIRHLFPDARIFGFEPVPATFAKLEQSYGLKPNIELFNVAAGAASGNAVMQVSAFSESSSLLPMAATHVQEFPWTGVEEQVDVPIRPLDEVLANDLQGPVLLKIDVQGFELAALEGAKRTLPLTDIILIELSLVPLYEGEPSFADIHQFLVQHGFVYKGSWHQLCSPRDGRPLQQDAIFIKRSPDQS